MAKNSEDIAKIPENGKKFLKKGYIFTEKGWYCKEHKAYFSLYCPECGEIKEKDTSISDGKIKKADVKASQKKSVKIGNSLTKHRLVPTNSIGSVSERFHNFRVKFKADIDWDLISEKSVRLSKNNYFKRLEFDKAIVQVFRHSILIIIRASAEIKGMFVDDAKSLSKAIIKDVIDHLPSTIRIKDSRVVATHNAFVGHPFAKDNVSVTIDGDKRWISDNSKGNMEFEAIHPDYAVPDSRVMECFMIDLITRPFDLPSVSKDKIDRVVDVLDGFAEQFKLHSDVQHRQADNMDKMNQNMDKMNIFLDQINGRMGRSPFVHSANHSLDMADPDIVGRDFHSYHPQLDRLSSLPTLNKDSSFKDLRLAKARYLLRQYGW